MSFFYVCVWVWLFFKSSHLCHHKSDLTSKAPFLLLFWYLLTEEFEVHWTCKYTECSAYLTFTAHFKTVYINRNWFIVEYFPADSFSAGKSDQLDFCNHMNYNRSISLWPMHLNHFSHEVLSVLVFKKNSKQHMPSAVHVMFLATFFTGGIMCVVSMQIWWALW